MKVNGRNNDTSVYMLKTHQPGCFHRLIIFENLFNEEEKFIFLIVNAFLKVYCPENSNVEN